MARSVLVNQPMTHYIFKEDQDSYYLFGKRLSETDASQHCELRVARKDGTRIWVQLHAMAAHKPDGSALCRLALSDITKRKPVRRSS